MLMIDSIFYWILAVEKCLFLIVFNSKRHLIKCFDYPEHITIKQNLHLMQSVISSDIFSNLYKIIDSKTYITQEMLKKGFFGGNSVYICTQHTKRIINDYFDILDTIFSELKSCEDGKDIKTLLDAPFAMKDLKG